MMEATDSLSEFHTEQIENGNKITDDKLKSMKKDQRNKQASHENGNSTANGIDIEQDGLKDIENGNGNIENDGKQMLVIDDDEMVKVKNTSGSTPVEFPDAHNECGPVEQNSLLEIIPESTTTTLENVVVPEAVEDDKKNCSIDSNGTDLIETECSANIILLSGNSCSTESEILQDTSVTDKSISESNTVNGNAEEFSAVNTSEIHTNGSKSDEEIFYETVQIEKETHNQAPPEFGVRDENSFTYKITNLLGKWQMSSPLQEQKLETEISSSKIKTNETICVKMDNGNPSMHPYLSKVTGRRGIKNHLNLGAANINVNEITPRSKGNTLNDSFRVKTDPPRLNQADVEEPVLRKYKGKRCLNVNNDYEEGEEAYMATTSKRLKLDEKTSGSGFLGSMFWSPFKKRYADKSLKVSESQSKLSRFLSPFWFWKKTVTDHNRK